jgi:hypothetical protein
MDWPKGTLSALFVSLPKIALTLKVPIGGQTVEMVAKRTDRTDR